MKYIECGHPQLERKNIAIFVLDSIVNISHYKIHWIKGKAEQLQKLSKNGLAIVIWGFFHGTNYSSLIELYNLMHNKLNCPLLLQVANSDGWLMIPWPGLWWELQRIRHLKEDALAKRIDLFHANKGDISAYYLMLNCSLTCSFWKHDPYIEWLPKLHACQVIQSYSNLKESLDALDIHKSMLISVVGPPKIGKSVLCARIKLMWPDAYVMEPDIRDLDTLYSENHDRVGIVIVIKAPTWLVCHIHAWHSFFGESDTKCSLQEERKVEPSSNYNLIELDYEYQLYGDERDKAFVMRAFVSPK